MTQLRRVTGGSERAEECQQSQRRGNSQSEANERRSAGTDAA